MYDYILATAILFILYIFSYVPFLFSYSAPYWIFPALCLTLVSFLLKLDFLLQVHICNAFPKLTAK